MKYLVTAASGQVGSAALKLLSKDGKNEVIGLSHQDLDITNRDDVLNSIIQIQPDVVVNTAAMTNVDLCEDEVSQAFAINAYGVRNLRVASEHVKAQLVHISTDFVFDGNSSRPYTEYDPTNPLSVYAKSKLGGDVEALSYDRGTVLRVAWVFGNPNGDFFSWVLNGVKDGSVKSVIDDQFSTPTFSQDVIPVIEKVCSMRMYGLINVANSGEASRLDMALEFLKKLRVENELTGIKAESLSRKALRPNYSSLSTDLLYKSTNIEMRNWQDTLNDHPLVTGN